MKKIFAIITILICTLLISCVSFDGTSGEPVYKQIHSTGNYGYGYVETSSTSVFVTGKNVVVRTYFKWDNAKNEYFSFIYPTTRVSNPRIYALDLGEEWASIGDNTSSQKYRDYCYNEWRKSLNADFKNTMYGTEYKGTKR